jgi:hypothetical protein
MASEAVKKPKRVRVELTPEPLSDMYLGESFPGQWA